MRRGFIALGIVGVALLFVACFGARTVQRSYFVLHGKPAIPRDEPLISGVVRVETLSADSAYQKFQIVVRRSPYVASFSMNAELNLSISSSNNRLNSSGVW